MVLFCPSLLVGSETLAKTNLKRKWFISLVLPSNRPLLRNVRAGTQAGAEAGIVEKIYLTLRLTSVTFHIKSRPTCSGLVWPTVAWDLLHYLALKKKAYRLVHRLVLGS